MAKRNADKELTDRNWDQEEEGEEVSGDLPHDGELTRDRSLAADRPVVACQAGTFSVASKDVLKNRAMKKAKRRNPAPEVQPREQPGSRPVAAPTSHPPSLPDRQQRHLQRLQRLLFGGGGRQPGRGGVFRLWEERRGDGSDQRERRRQHSGPR